MHYVPIVVLVSIAVYAAYYALFVAGRDCEPQPPPIEPINQRAKDISKTNGSARKIDIVIKKGKV